MQGLPYSVGLRSPVGVVVVFIANLRFPKGDMTGTTNAVNSDQFASGLLDSLNLCGIGGQILLSGKIALRLRYC